MLRAAEVNELYRYNGRGDRDLPGAYGIGDATFYIWKKKYSSVGLSELHELRQLREEKRQT